jgi:hypothetical protein
MSKSTDRVREYRKAARSEGWAFIMVKCPKGKEAQVKEYAESLGEPSPKALPGQQALPFGGHENE